MKAIQTFAVVVVIILITGLDANAWYKLVLKNGRDNGPGQAPTYNCVCELSDFWGTSIWCENPGSENCPVKISVNARPYSKKIKAEQLCLDHAKNEIAKGILNNHWTDPTTKFYVKWSSNGKETFIYVLGPGESMHETRNIIGWLQNIWNKTFCTELSVTVHNHKSLTYY